MEFVTNRRTLFDRWWTLLFVASSICSFGMKVNSILHFKGSEYHWGLIRAHMKSYVQFWVCQYKKDVDKLAWWPPTWWGAGALALWGDAEGMGLVQPSEEMALEGPNSSLVIPGENNAERKWIASCWDGRERCQCQIRSSGFRGLGDRRKAMHLYGPNCG